MSGRQDRRRTFGASARLRGPVEHNKNVALHRKIRAFSRAAAAAGTSLRRFVRALEAFRVSL